MRIRLKSCSDKKFIKKVGNSNLMHFLYYFKINNLYFPKNMSFDG